jgi:dTDP-4-amino-4,6-dideoxygalactose transaminase
MLRVPFVDLVPQPAPLRAELLSALTRVVDSGRFILGPEVALFEREAARYLAVPHAVGVSSGSDALVCALLATGVGAGDEVITPGLSFFATAGAVLRVGAVPRFADVESETLNLSPAACERAITARTKAILVVHLYGAPARLDALVELARRAKLTLIEDAAQAFSARYEEKAVGTLGTIGCFSFFPTKPLGGLGDGGLVCTAHPELAERLRRIRTHGAERRHEHVMLGGNFRLDELQAAALRVKLPHLSAALAERARMAKRYDEAFASIDGMKLLANSPDHFYIPDRSLCIEEADFSWGRWVSDIDDV